MRAFLEKKVLNNLVGKYDVQAAAYSTAAIGDFSNFHQKNGKRTLKSWGF
jgi:hypothetical protein